MPIQEQVTSAAKAGAAAGSFFKSLGTILGGQPRGNLQKFNRTVGPLMQAQADLSKRSVFAFWFGDLIEVQPGGQVLLAARPGTLANSHTVVRQIAKERGTSVFEFSCAGDVDFESIDEVSRKCDFRQVGESSFFERLPFVGETKVREAAVGPALGVGQIALLAGVGLVVFVAGRR